MQSFSCSHCSNRSAVDDTSLTLPASVSSHGSLATLTLPFTHKRVLFWVYRRFASSVDNLLVELQP